MVVDHLLRLNFEDHTINPTPIQESFSNEHLLAVQSLPWYADMVNYLVKGKTQKYWSSNDRKGFLPIARHFYFDDPYLNMVLTNLCVPNEEISQILSACHTEACGGYFS